MSVWSYFFVNGFILFLIVGLILLFKNIEMSVSDIAALGIIGGFLMLVCLFFTTVAINSSLINDDFIAINVNKFGYVLEENFTEEKNCKKYVLKPSKNLEGIGELRICYNLQEEK